MCMEKYYCEKCRVLYPYDVQCETCGSGHLRKIKIEVHNQEGNRRMTK